MNSPGSGTGPGQCLERQNEEGRVQGQIRDVLDDSPSKAAGGFEVVGEGRTI